MVGWKRASPIHIVIVSQVRCLTSHFSSKADVGMFLFGLVRGIGFVCSPCLGSLGRGARGERGEVSRGCRQNGGGECAQGLAARLLVPCPTWAKVQLRPWSQLPGKQAASGDATC